MSGDTNEENRLQVLMMEYDKCYDKVLYIDGQGNKAIENFFIALGVLIAFCGYTFTVWMGHGFSRVLAFFFVDIGIFILNFLLIYAFHIMVLCVRAGGYMKYLEEQINLSLSENILCWENKIAQRLVHKGRTSLVIFLLVGLMFVLTSAGALYTCVTEVLITRFWYLGVIILVMFLSEFVGAFIIKTEASKAHVLSYNISKENNHK